MSKSEFIIWKTELLEKVKKEHPNFTKEQCLEYLRSIADEIRESAEEFFGDFPYKSEL